MLAREAAASAAPALEQMLAKEGEPTLLLSPATADRDEALGWLERTGGALDGVIAKRLDEPYRPGERAMVKVKQRRTADCVVGGFRYGRNDKLVASLLLGLYDDAGLLHHVGFTSSIAAKDRPAWTKELEKLVEPPGFTGNAPGGPSRWSTERTAEWQPLKPKIVDRSALRPGHRRPLPPRHQVAPPPSRQGAAAMHDASSSAHPLTPAELKQLMKLMLFDAPLVPGLAYREELIDARGGGGADRGH